MFKTSQPTSGEDSSGPFKKSGTSFKLPPSIFAAQESKKGQSSAGEGLFKSGPKAGGSSIFGGGSQEAEKPKFGTSDLFKKPDDGSAPSAGVFKIPPSATASVFSSPQTKKEPKSADNPFLAPPKASRDTKVDPAHHAEEDLHQKKGVEAAARKNPFAIVAAKSDASNIFSRSGTNQQQVRSLL